MRWNDCGKSLTPMGSSIWITLSRSRSSGWSLSPRVSADTAGTLAPLERVRKFEGLDLEPRFVKYFDGSSRAARICAELIGETRLRLLFLSCFAKPARHGTATPWHQDQGLWGFWMPNALSCWLAIDECTPENGCLEFIPGSHLEGMAEHITHAGAPHVYAVIGRRIARRTATASPTIGASTLSPKCTY